jgi:small subunit ribosomal protein S1
MQIRRRTGGLKSYNSGDSAMENQTEITSESAPNIDLNEIKRKARFTGTILKTTLAGALVDIGLGIQGVIHISQIQEQPINRVEDVVKVGQTVDVWVRKVDVKRNRIELTMIKPLDLEWREIEPGMVIKGRVTRLENFGVFIDVGAERPGLVHISEMTHDYVKNPGELVKEGDEVDVQVLEVNKRKKQIRLSMKALIEKPEATVKAIVDRRDKEKERDREVVAEVVEKEEAVPTAMEIALREAMERRQQTQGVQKKSKRKNSGADEIDRILARTLDHKIRTGR